MRSEGRYDSQGQKSQPPAILRAFRRRFRGGARHGPACARVKRGTSFGKAGSRAQGIGPMVLERPGRTIGRSCQPRHGCEQPTVGVDGRPRRIEARRQRGGRFDRDGGGSQRHGAEHDRRRRRRVHDDLPGEDQQARRAQRQRARAARAESRLLHVAQDRADADDRHGAGHRPRRVRRLGHAARQVRHDEAGGAARAGDRLRRERLRRHGKDVGRLGPGNPPPQTDAGSGGHLRRQRRRTEARRHLLSEESGPHPPRAGREAFYRGEIARAIVDYCRKNGGFLSMEDFAAHKSEWVEPISTTYRGHTLHELPPNGQGLTALILANILDGIDLASLRTRPGLYYHTLIEATKVAFADRNRYIADPAFAKVPVKELLSKDYAAGRRRLIDPQKAIDPPAYGDLRLGSDTTYFTVVDKDRSAVSFINSIFSAFGSALVAGDTGIVLQNRGAGFSLEPGHPNRIEPGKRPFHTLIPAMVFKDGQLLMAYGVMGGDVQAQGHLQLLANLIDRGLNLQQAIDAPRVRYISGRVVMMDDELTAPVIDELVQRGHERVLPGPGLTHRALMGGGQAIMIDPASGSLLGASDSRKDGLALGY